MIKVAISGADNPVAGELIRILVNHPDVEIVALVAPGHEGKQVQALHHGLLGETPISFTSVVRPAEADILFIADREVPLQELARLHEAYPDLKVVAMKGFSGEPAETQETEDEANNNMTPVYGLPEINRKTLVRGASDAALPSPFASLALVSLFPLATHMLLSGDIVFDLSAPEDMVSKKELERAVREISEQLHIAQRSFNGSVSFSLLPPSSKRGIEIKTELKAPLDLEQTLSTFDIYDDHNFAFPTISSVKLDDVKGTEKIIVSLSRAKEGSLKVHAVADGRLRGSAGEAVHVMNLMFGLHEKTGLYLKPYAF